jgi:hypothetical protein
MRVLRGVLIAVLSGASALWAMAQEPAYLADRGPGIPTSLFGTYVEKGELLVYPFYEYTRTSAFEYKPSELGFTGEQDYLGETVEQEYLLFLSYGISNRMSVELESALHAKTSFDKAPDDVSAVPQEIDESGLGDVDLQLRYRWAAETEHRPEMFSFVEITPPFQRNKVLIGTHDWEGALGFGAVRGFSWGTLTGRAALAYDGEDSQVELGEFAFEYLKRVTERWRVVGALEGESDELALIGEAQWFFGQHAMLKLNCGFGPTEKTADVAPEVGVLFRF